MTTYSTEKLISIVIPIYNEADNLQRLFERLSWALDKKYNYEIIFINDGSNDNSETIIKQNIHRNNRIKMIIFSRNFGHQEAITAGLEYAKGDAVIIMDGDLQDPPEVLHRFIEKWLNGWDVVYAIRKKRKENIFKRFAYSVFYRILNEVSLINIPLDSGDFSLMDRKIVDYINSLPERNRFIRGIRAWLGFKQIGFEYEREERFAGRSKYNTFKLMKLALDGIISISYKPLIIATHLGIIISLFSSIAIVIIFCIKVFTEKAIPGWASILIITLFMGSIQLFAIGALGEYIGRIYDEVKKRPNYIIKEIIDEPEKMRTDESPTDN